MLIWYDSNQCDVHINAMIILQNFRVAYNVNGIGRHLATLPFTEVELNEQVSAKY